MTTTARTHPMRRPDYATPFADLFRELTPAERRELTDSIRAAGVLSAVLVYTSPEHGPSILDGLNRWAIARELGVPCPVNDLGSMGDQDARELAEQANHCRRHLTPADWQAMAAARAERVKRVAEKRKEGKSLRTIAEEEGISEKTVRKDIDEATADGSAVEPESGKVMGKDGKERPATQPAKPKPARPQEVTAQPVSQPESKPVGDTVQKDKDDDEDDITVIGDDPDELDRIELSHADPLFHVQDNPKPTARPSLTGLDGPPTEESLIAKEAVAKYPKFRRWVLAMGRMVTEFSDLMKGPGTHYLRNLMVDGEPVLKEASKDSRTATGTTRERVWVYPPLVKFVEFVKNALPHKVCDGCRGHGESRDGRTCPACGSVGYLPVVRLPPPKAGHLPFAPTVDPWELDDLPEG